MFLDRHGDEVVLIRTRDSHINERPAQFLRGLSTEVMAVVPHDNLAIHLGTLVLASAHQHAVGVVIHHDTLGLTDS